MPPDDTTTSQDQQIPVVVPATTDTTTSSTEPDVAALVATLSPRNMDRQQQPTEPNPAVVKPDTQTSSPKDKTIPVNFAELRKAREEAEKRVSTLESELTELRSKVSTSPDLKKLQDQLAAAEKERSDLHETVARVAVQKTPAYVEKKELIDEAKKDIKAALTLVKDTVGSLTISDLSDPKKYNSVLQALMEGGEHKAIEDLKMALNASTMWERDLKKMEEDSRVHNEKWAKDRAAAAQSRLSQTKANLSGVNPALVPGTPEFQSHPKEVQEVILGAHATAEKMAIELQSKTPEEQLDHFYASTLSANLNLQQRNALATENKSLQEQVATLSQRLSAYEKTTSTPAVGSGGGGAANSPEELAKRLSPRAMRA